MIHYYCRRQILLQVLLVFILVFSFASCSSGKLATGNHDMVTGPNGPRKIYVPAYYTYRNGNYHFVKGHYRLVLNRRLYLARANRCYSVEASAR